MSEDKNRVYPKTTTLNVGDVFSRLPRELNFNKVKGTHPMYGRTITKIERTSEHKLLVTLGISEWGGAGYRPSNESVVAVYGEIDIYVVSGCSEDDEFAKLWLDEENK